MDRFSAGQAARLTGLKYDILDYWATSQFIAPSLQVAGGKGTNRSYTFRDLVALRVARELRDARVSLQTLRQIVARLRAMDGIESPLTEVRLVLVGEDVAVLNTDAELLSLLKRPGQTYLTAVVNLANVVEDLRRAMAA